jgi:hypothetical protein
MIALTNIFHVLLPFVQSTVSWNNRDNILTRQSLSPGLLTLETPLGTWRYLLPTCGHCRNYSEQADIADTLLSTYFNYRHLQHADISGSLYPNNKKKKHCRVFFENTGIAGTLFPIYRHCRHSYQHASTTDIPFNPLKLQELLPIYRNC